MEYLENVVNRLTKYEKYIKKCFNDWLFKDYNKEKNIYELWCRKTGDCLFGFLAPLTFNKYSIGVFLKSIH